MSQLEQRSLALQVTVHLLDSSSGLPVMTWQFAEKGVITIGRSPDQEVPVGDPHVSRQHAEIVFDGGVWSLVSLGRNGVMVDQRKVENARLQNNTVFRLGTSGPLLRFAITGGQQEDSITLGGEAEIVPVLLVDSEQRDKEVEDIAESDFFRSLAARAAKLRDRRPPES